ncbi:hypothetical protein [Pseudomonas sp. C9]
MAYFTAVNATTPNED